MIYTILNWLYIAITVFIIGWGSINGLEKILKDVAPHNVFDYIFGGFIIATFYAEVFSLFGGVSLCANIIMIVACIIIYVVCRRDIIIFISNNLSSKKEVNFIIKIVMGIMIAMTVVICLTYTSQSTFHYDTGLYHAQAIHWLEEYGLIKGLGRIHVRFAYNSALFPVCALYSFKSLTGQSLHSVSGFMFTLICLYSIYGWFISIRNNTFLRKSAVSDLIRIAPFFYLLCCLLEITSPESDYVTMIFFIWVILRFVEIGERNCSCGNGYILVSIVAFMVVSFKLSAAPVVLVTIWPLYLLIKNKNYKNILICAGIVSILLIPWLIRNYYICGWLIYPVSSIDLFNPIWKFSKEMVAGDASEIGAWAMETQNGMIPMGVEWLRLWWSRQNEATQLFLYSLIVSIPMAGFIYIKEFLSLFVKKLKANIEEPEKKRRILILYLIGLVIITLTFYMKTAPLIRYCYGPVLILPLMIGGYLLSVATSQKKGKIIAIIVATICVIAILIPSAKSCKALLKFDYEESMARYDFKDTLIRQIDYPKPDVQAIEWCGMTVYIPNEGDQCWYDAFPSSPYREGFKYTTLIGDKLSEGVMPIQ